MDEEIKTTKLCIEDKGTSIYLDVQTKMTVEDASSLISKLKYAMEMRKFNSFPGQAKMVRCKRSKTPQEVIDFIKSNPKCNAKALVEKFPKIIANTKRAQSKLSYYRSN